MKPNIFIGSSVEGLNTAFAIQKNLDYEANVTVWTQGVFELSQTAIESLITVMDKADYAIFVFTPDDKTFMRKTEHNTVRDNVIFELGMFIGKLGRQRVFIIAPDGSDMHIPTDLLGITIGNYNSARDDGNLQAATGGICHKVSEIMKKLGLLHPKDSYEGTEKNKSKIEDNNQWFLLFLDENYNEAKLKLSELISEIGDDDGVRSLWMKLCDHKVGIKCDFHELMNDEKTLKNKKIKESIIKFLIMEKMYPLAKSFLEEIVSNDNDKDFILLLSECLVDSLDTECAISLLEDKNIGFDPEFSVALADLYRSEERGDEAFNIILRSYENNQNNETTLYALATLMDEKNEDKISLYLWDCLRKNHAKTSLYWGNFSNVCLSLELYDNSYLSCKNAIKLSEEKEEWLMANLGNIYNNKGLYSKAAETLKMALSIEKGSAYTHKRLSNAIENIETENNKLAEHLKAGRAALKNMIVDLS